MAEKIKIYKPKNDHAFMKWRHAGDTFREMIDIWAEKGYVEVVETNEDNDGGGMVWMYEKNDVLLYDRPTFEWFPQNTNYKIGLFGNPKPLSSNEWQVNAPWIFWGRRPRLLEEYSNKTPKTYEERITSSIFIGNIENNVQEQFRMKYSNEDWRKAVELFELTIGNNHKYTHTKYLEALGNSKFGLSMRGYGPKCNREIELLALGVVPLLTEDVDTTYYDPLIEGLHYFRVKDPSDIKAIVDKCSKEQWEFMSNAGRRWYERNCSAKGSFFTTKRIIEKIRNDKENKKESVQCISTMATENSYKDLQLMLFSLYQFHPTMKVYVVCDDFVGEALFGKTDKDGNVVEEGWLSLNVPTLQIICIESLSQYTEMNRQQMEKNGTWLMFMLRKCDGIDYAMHNDNQRNVLFVDSDMVFLNTIEDQCGIDNTHNGMTMAIDIGRSPHYNRKVNQEQFGKYNGGFLFINHHGFTDWWKFASSTKSRYYEQASIEDADEAFSTFDVPIQYNYGWWRLYECEPNQIVEREKQFRVIDGTLMYDGSPLRTIHTHFEERKFSYIVKYNIFIMRLLLACKNDKQKNIFHYINDNFFNLSAKNDNSSQIAIKTPMTDFIHVIVNYYNDLNESRQEEIDFCVNANISNPHVSKVHILTTNKNVEIPEWLSEDKKFVFHCIEKSVDSKLTFREAFEYANETIPTGSVACICNPDTFLDHASPWKDLERLIDFKIIPCLSSYEFDGEESAKKDEQLQNLAYAHVQNAWVFKTPFIVRDCNFEMNQPFSDNKIADRIKISGYTPMNNTNQFKLYHYQRQKDKVCQELDQEKETKILERGYYLVPDVDAIQSLDKLVDDLELSAVQKYQIVCDVMSKYITSDNLVTLKSN